MGVSNSHDFYEHHKHKILLYDLVLLKKGEATEDDLLKYFDIKGYTKCGMVVTKEVCKIDEPHILIPHSKGFDIISFSEAFEKYDRVSWCPLIWNPTVSPNSHQYLEKVKKIIGSNNISIRTIYETLNLIPDSGSKIISDPITL